VKLRLTEEGQRTVESLIPMVVSKLNLVLSDFSREEVAELTRLLNKFILGLQLSSGSKAGEAA
jgi:DNA-binding MarR family transcriptional regulator